MRAFWTGEIAMGLVTIPAKAYTATKDMTPQFHEVHTKCGTRPKRRHCTTCKRDLAWEEIGKGYEVAKNEYALFTKEELARLDAPDDSGTIEIVGAVDPTDVDLAYVEKSYWIGPGGRNGRSYEALRAMLEETGKVALCKVRLRTRTRLALLRPRGRLFALDVLRHADELVPGDEIAPGEQDAPSDWDKQVAARLIEALSGPFDPGKHPDAYRSAVLGSVEQKIEAGEVRRNETLPAEPWAGTSLVEATASDGTKPGLAKGADVVDLAEWRKKRA